MGKIPEETGEYQWVYLWYILVWGFKNAIQIGSKGLDYVTGI